MRDPDGWTYFKEETGGLVVGGFEPEAKPWRSPDDLPYPFEFQLLPEDWEHFSVLMDEALLRIPALEETGIRKFYNGPGVVHARQPVPARARRPGCAASSSGPASTRSASPPRAGPAGRWRSGSWRGSRRTTWSAVDVRRFAPLHADNRLAARPGSPRCSGCTTRCRGPTASSSRRGRSGSRRCTSGWPRPVRCSARGWAGSGRTSSVRRAPTLDYSWGKPSWLAVVGGRAARDPRRRRGLRPDVVLQVRRRRAATRWPACSGSAPPTSTCRSAAASTRRSSTRAAPTRPT